MAGSVNKIIYDADIDSNFEYVWNHGLGTVNINANWYDSTGADQTAPDTFQVIDADNVKVSFGGPLTGGNNLVLFYDNTVVLEGKQLFDLDIGTPVGTERLALGTPSDPAFNISYDDFIQATTDNLGNEFLRVDQNLGDINDYPVARDNLSVYAISTLDTKFGLKANTSGIFNTVNSDTAKNSYSPTEEKDITVKDWVDTRISGATLSTLNITNQSNDFVGGTTATSPNAIFNFIGKMDNSYVYNFQLSCKRVGGNSGLWTKLGTIDMLAGQTVTARYFWGQNFDNQEVFMKPGLMRITSSGEVYLRGMTLAGTLDNEYVFSGELHLWI